MTKVTNSLVTWLKGRLVIALVQRKNPLEKGLPCLRHLSVAVDNLLRSQFPYSLRPSIQISVQVHLQVALPPRGSHS